MQSGDHDLPLDLSDPESISKAIPSVEAIVDDKRQIALEATQELGTWEALLRNLRSIAGLVLRFPSPYGVSPEAINAVVRIVEQAGMPTQPIAVERALISEGHDVEDREAVFAVLVAAARAGRLQQVAPRQFTPNKDDEATPGHLIAPVPEAHLGLDGPPPRSKAEAVLRVLGSAPNREWSAENVGRLMVARNWMTDSDRDSASLGAILSRLHADGKIFRPQRGRYQLAPPEDGLDQ